MKTKKQKSTAGFSLVELMVVVAIIGILATVAIPNFTKFQARAKQSGAKAELSGLFTAQKAFYSEWTTYHTNLPYTGFIPEGFPVAAGCPGALAGVNRLYSTGFVANGAGTAAVNAQPTGAGPIPAGCNAYANLTGRYDASANIQALTAGSVAANATFLAEAAGVIATGGAVAADRWTINENKSLVNSASGL